jgi:hypothetical protein
LSVRFHDRCFCNSCSRDPDQNRNSSSVSPPPSSVRRASVEEQHSCYRRSFYSKILFYIESRRQSNENDCIVLSSSESENEDNDLFNENSANSLQSLIESNIDDGRYWEDIARITYLISDDNNNDNDQNLNRKRSNSSNSSLLSNNDENYHQPKRIKQSTNHQVRTSDIEVITLSSSDSSDNEDQLF